MIDVRPGPTGFDEQRQAFTGGVQCGVESTLLRQDTRQIAKGIAKAASPYKRTAAHPDILPKSGFGAGKVAEGPAHIGEIADAFERADFASAVPIERKRLLELAPRFHRIAGKRVQRRGAAMVETEQ